MCKIPTSIVCPVHFPSHQSYNHKIDLLFLHQKWDPFRDFFVAPGATSYNYYKYLLWCCSSHNKPLPMPHEEVLSFMYNEANPGPLYAPWSQYVSISPRTISRIHSLLGKRTEILHAYKYGPRCKSFCIEPVPSRQLIPFIEVLILHLSLRSRFLLNVPPSPPQSSRSWFATLRPFILEIMIPSSKRPYLEVLTPLLKVRLT